MPKLNIDVVSDMICPWCFIGSRRLDQALESLGDAVEATVTHHPFLLDPSIPAGGQDLRERLQKKYGGDPERMFARVEAAAHESGIPLDFAKVRRSSSTIAAHTLLRNATRKGTQHALAEAIYDAYFMQGRDISDAAVLTELAVKHGFTEKEAQALINDQMELATTRAEAETASRAGISGVPFFVLGGSVAVSGAQSVDVLKSAIERVISPSTKSEGRSL